MTEIIERIEREAGVPHLATILADRLSPTDLQSLLLEVYRLRSAQRSPAVVLSEYEANRFVRPSAVSPPSLLRWDEIALSHLPAEFEPIALSPVCPLGTNAAVAPVDQNWTVATARNTEVVSDSTNVLALECALRRRTLLRASPKSSDSVHLAASHRLLRAQHYARPGFSSHFASFALCSAGRDQGNLHFELSALRSHIRFYLAALRTFLGPKVSLQVSLTQLDRTTPREGPWTEFLAEIRKEFADVACGFDESRSSGRGYYQKICFHIHAGSARHAELVDGGCVDWTQKLVGNAKERLIISGIGSERLCTEFGNA